MSGIVFVSGDPDRQSAETMMARIRHRGPFLSGFWTKGRMVLGQNYCRPETNGAEEGSPVPFTTPFAGGPAVGCDIQMGNRRERAAETGVAEGPFVQERLLLELYRRHGTGMLEYLDDAVFSFVIADGDRFFAARDLLGIKTLFYGRSGGTLYLASELKSILAVTGEVYEFPPGHWMKEDGRPVRFSRLPERPPEPLRATEEEMAAGVRAVVEKSVRSRVDFRCSTASLLSGGMDSSVVALLAQRIYKERYGDDARLRTLAFGIGESEDILSARTVAEHIGSEHREVVVTLEEALEAVDKTVYHLESFDPSLVRSAVSNYLVSGFAASLGVEVLLSGEGGDEIFCGYMYLKEFPAEELFDRQMECLQFLHNNAALRLDRMNQCHSIQVVAPLISGELFRYTAAMPPECKLRRGDGDPIEKWIFRKAFEADLPDAITWRLKKEFSQGAGAAELLPEHFEKTVSDAELKKVRERHPMVRSKEECHYFKIFTGHFGSGKAVDTVGQWIRL